MIPPLRCQRKSGFEQRVVVDRFTKSNPFFMLISEPGDLSPQKGLSPLKSRYPLTTVVPLVGLVMRQRPLCLTTSDQDEIRLALF